MLGLSAKQPFGLPPAALQEAAKYPPGLPAASEALRRACLSAPQLPGNIFGAFDESLLARAEALAAAAELASSPGKSSAPFQPDGPFQTMSAVPCASATSPPSLPAPHHPNHHHHHHSHHPHPHPHGHPAVAHPSLEGGGGDLLEHLSPSALMGGPEHGGVLAGPLHPHALGPLHQALAAPGPPPPPPPPSAAPGSVLGCLGEASAEPRELEAFAERFKQRRIKLGVTQADVGAALAELKLPGVGSLSQSTICRFESLTLSHNNMVALQPVLHAWLEEAEEAAQRQSSAKAAAGGGELFGAAAAAGGGLGPERKRKRTSIAAPEKRSLEAYFALQPRPSSEKIAAIAEKLELKKNVVRVWFCNQRQKQKRMKYSALH